MTVNEESNPHRDPLEEAVLNNNRLGTLAKRAFLELGYEWEPQEHYLARVATYVHPGKAVRRYDNLVKNRGVEPQSEPSREDRQAVGARSIAYDVLDMHRRAGRLQRKVVMGEKWVRRRPLMEEGGDVVPFPRGARRPKAALPPIPCPRQYPQLVRFW